jgi:hypothetical protein
VLAPVGELVGVLRELGLQGLDGRGVLVEEDLRERRRISEGVLFCLFFSSPVSLREI